MAMTMNFKIPEHEEAPMNEADVMNAKVNTVKEKRFPTKRETTPKLQHHCKARVGGWRVRGWDCRA